MIDLHAHTTASDGQHPADELFRLAKGAGVTQLAVTDHDTVAGLPAAEAAAQAHGLTLIPGIEISATLHRREIHILGHFLDREDLTLGKLSERLRAERRARMEAMVQKVQGLGFPIRMEHVLAIAQDANLGRPHLARVFVHAGYCLDTKEAFDRFLGEGKPAYVDRFRLSYRDAIALIRGAGGTATLAHPGVNRVERAELVLLKDAGLSGIEALHSEHPPHIRDKYRRWAEELSLVPTAGSDFHGEAVAPGRKLGTADTGLENLQRLRSLRPAAKS